MAGRRAGRGWMVAAAVVALVGAARAVRAQTQDGPSTGALGEASLVGRTQAGERVLVPLRHTDVAIDVRGLVAAATVTQHYVNDGPEPLEAVYVFPLPHEAAVYDLEIRIGDRVIHSAIRERAEAKRTYEAARASGQRAALVEQERPNVFTASVANLMPNDHIDVRLRYVEALRWEGGRVRLTFPMVVGPRYVPGTPLDSKQGQGVTPDTGAVPDASRMTPPLRMPDTRPGHDLSLAVRLDAGVPLAEVTSPTHPVNVVALAQGGQEVRLRTETTLPNRDFVLEFRPADSARPRAALFLSKDIETGEAHALIAAFPPTRDESSDRLPVEMLFVIDVSGSMEGTSIQEARDALLQALDRLRPGDRFDVVAFSSGFTAFRPGPVAVTPETLAAGRAFVRGLRADGGTEMLPALEHVMAMPTEEGAVRQIVLLTDGCLGNEDQIFTSLEQRLGRARLFTVAIGSAPNHHLAARMADYGRGAFTHIADPSEVGTRMGALLDLLERPALADITVTASGAELTEMYPARPPDLFPDRPLVLYARLRADARGTLRITGRRGDAEYVEEIPFDAAAATFHPGITTLWARQKLAEKLDSWRRATDDDARQGLKDEIVKDAMAYRLVTKFTSLVAVEEQVVNPGGPAATAVVPTELPQGWDPQAWFGDQPKTGTADDFLLLVGWLLVAGGLLLALRRWMATRPARTS